MGPQLLPTRVLLMRDCAARSAREPRFNTEATQWPESVRMRYDLSNDTWSVIPGRRQRNWQKRSQPGLRANPVAANNADMLQVSCVNIPVALRLASWRVRV